MRVLPPPFSYKFRKWATGMVGRTSAFAIYYKEFRSNLWGTILPEYLYKKNTGRRFWVNFFAYGRPAVRIPFRYEALRCDKNKDCARVKHVYEKYVKMGTKFVPYLVRN